MCLPFVVLSLKTISHLCPCSAVSPASPLLNFHVALRLLEHPSRKQVPLIIAMCCNCRITKLFYMGKKKAPLKKISWEWIISEAQQRELLCFSKGRREADSCILRFRGLSHLLWHPDMRTVKTTHCRVKSLSECATPFPEQENRNVAWWVIIHTTKS